MKTLSQTAVSAMLVSVLFGVTGCSTKIGPLSKDNCEMSNTQKLEFAVDDVKSRLQNGCARQFSGYFNRLLQVGAGFPKPENAAVYQDFLRWSVNQGIVSKVQAGDRYNRYFSKTFSGLSNTQSVSSSVCPTLDETLSGLRSELADKKTGLQDILAQNGLYQESTRLYYNLELNLHAICAASDAA